MTDQEVLIEDTETLFFPSLNRIRGKDRATTPCLRVGGLQSVAMRNNT
jgi:hypothetical protein